MTITKMAVVGLLKTAELTEKDKKDAVTLGGLTGAGAGLGTALNAYLTAEGLSRSANKKADESQALLADSYKKTYQKLLGKKPSRLRAAAVNKVFNKVLENPARGTAAPDFTKVGASFRALVTKPKKSTLALGALTQGALVGVPVAAAATLGTRKLLDQAAYEKNKQIKNRESIIDKLKARITGETAALQNKGY